MYVSPYVNLTFWWTSDMFSPFEKIGFLACLWKEHSGTVKYTGLTCEHNSHLHIFYKFWHYVSCTYEEWKADLCLNMLPFCYQGYHGDTSKTFLCGNVIDPLKRLVRVSFVFACTNYSQLIERDVVVSCHHFGWSLMDQSTLSLLS